MLITACNLKKCKIMFWQNHFLGRCKCLQIQLISHHFVDVNGDGDMDMVNYNVSMSKLVYYENQKSFKNIPCDSVYFEIADSVGEY